MRRQQIPLVTETQVLWGKLWVILTQVTMTMWKTCLPFLMTSSALIGLTSLALVCTTPLLYLLFQAAGYFWCFFRLGWLIINFVEVSNIRSLDSESSEETLRKMWRWLPRLASQMWWCWCRCWWSKLEHEMYGGFLTSDLGSWVPEVSCSWIVGGVLQTGPGGSPHLHGGWLCSWILCTSWSCF